MSQDPYKNIYEKTNSIEISFLMFGRVDFDNQGRACWTGISTICKQIYCEKSGNDFTTFVRITSHFDNSEISRVLEKETFECLTVGHAARYVDTCMYYMTTISVTRHCDLSPSLLRYLDIVSSKFNRNIFLIDLRHSGTRGYFRFTDMLFITPNGLYFNVPHLTWDSLE